MEAQWRRSQTMGLRRMNWLMNPFIQLGFLRVVGVLVITYGAAIFLTGLLFGWTDEDSDNLY